MKLQEYFEFKALSKSYLVQLSRAPSELTEEKLSRYLERGSALDVLVTEGPEKYQESYAEEPIPPSRGDVYTILRAYAEGVGMDSLEKIHASTRLSTNLKTVLGYASGGDWKTYVEAIKDLKARNKSIISKEDERLVFSAYARLMKDKYINPILVSDKIHFQVPHIAEINEEPVKCLVDFMIVDEENKVIYPYDLKSTSDSPVDFRKSYYKYRYDIQGSLYSKVLQENYPNYRIANFTFVVVQLGKNTRPMLFEMSEAELEGARTGRFVGSVYYKGYDELIEDYKLHKALDKWDYPADYLRQGKYII